MKPVEAAFDKLLEATTLLMRIHEARYHNIDAHRHDELCVELCEVVAAMDAAVEEL